MSIQTRMIRLLEAAALTPEQKADIDAIYRMSPTVRKNEQNPFVGAYSSFPPAFVVCFMTNNKDSEPLYWTNSGFKNMRKVNKRPEFFSTKEEAEKKLRTEILDYIRQWRQDQTHLIIGW